MQPDRERLRAFWDGRYREFSLSESGWLGAGDRLNHYLYACKTAALRRALSALGLSHAARFSVLDAGCGQGYFARFYAQSYAQARYVGVDISERAVSHLCRTMPGVEFHHGDLAEWRHPDDLTFDLVQTFEVLHLILDDRTLERAVANLAARAGVNGTLLMTAALPDETVAPTSYTRFRSRRFWEDLLASHALRIVSERPMYYWLPAGGPRNRYMRFAFDRLGAAAAYTVDRVALALHAPRSSSEPMDSRMRLLAIRRA